MNGEDIRLDGAIRMSPHCWHSVPSNSSRHRDDVDIQVRIGRAVGDASGNTPRHIDVVASDDGDGRAIYRQLTCAADDEVKLVQRTALAVSRTVGVQSLARPGR